MKHSDRIFQVRIREHYFSKVYIAMICLNLFMISALGAIVVFCWTSPRVCLLFCRHKSQSWRGPVSAFYLMPSEKNFGLGLWEDFSLQQKLHFYGNNCEDKNKIEETLQYVSRAVPTLGKFFSPSVLVSFIWVTYAHGSSSQPIAYTLSTSARSKQAQGKYWTNLRLVD